MAPASLGPSTEAAANLAGTAAPPLPPRESLAPRLRTDFPICQVATRVLLEGRFERDSSAAGQSRDGAKAVSGEDGPSEPIA